MLGWVIEINMITIDIETKSDKDISKCGIYAYTDTPYFDILLFAYSIDEQPVQVVDMANGEEIPESILAALADENVVKRAFNVNFERVCLSKYLRKNYPQYFQSYSIDEDTVGDFLNPESWHCSMIHARTLGLPSSLAEVGKVLGIEQQKMTEGKALVKFFCVPYDTVDGVPQFHNPKDYPDKWEIFKAYNKRDVGAELEIDRRLSRFPVPDFLWKEFYLDQEINDRGILVDMQLADKAISLDAEAKEELTVEMKRLTGVENPNSVYQLLDWLETQGYKSDSLGKAQVQELIKTTKEPVKSVLQMRLQLSKSSVKKYTAMKNTACSDNRARGMFSFYGASRTGRWAGRNVQLQNLPQNHLPDLTEARELVKYGSFEDIQMLYDEYKEAGDDSVVILGIAAPDYGSEVSQEEITAFLEENGYSYPVLMDDGGNVFTSYGVYSYPTTFMFNADGNVFGYAPGMLAEEMMRSIIEQTESGVRQ